MSKYYPKDEYPDVWSAAPKVRALFRLDARSDQSLENAWPDRLRELYKQGAPGPDGKPPVMYQMGSLARQGFQWRFTPDQ